jgi:hypothetical protein
MLLEEKATLSSFSSALFEGVVNRGVFAGGFIVGNCKQLKQK